MQALALREGFMFYKLSYKDGEAVNVGNPLTKTFVKYVQDRRLRLRAEAGRMAAARALDMGMAVGGDPYSKAGIIFPQVITMGIITRRAIELTWLTASNAKKNRVGSELNSMVCAPRGYAIVGADVDLEEL